MTMTQSRSSILLALAVLMIVVVESSTQNIDKIDNDNDNQTQYHLDIQTNFIDSELNEDENDVREVHPTEPNVIDLDPEYLNITIPADIVNTTALNKTEENNIKNDVTIDEISTPEIQHIQENANETNKEVDNLGKIVEAAPLETTPLPILDETIPTLVPISENISFNENTPATVNTAQIETQTTETYEIQQASPTNRNSVKLHDLSIYFEDEPSRARQLRGSIQETDNDVVAHSDPESESDSSSNISKSSESEISHSSDVLSAQDENKAAEDSSIPEDLLNEKTPAEPKTGTFANITIEDPEKLVAEHSVEEIVAVTESAGEITYDVTVVANEETHTIMKKPGVENESPTNTTDGSIQEQTNETAAVSRPDTELDPVVNLVLNRPKELLGPSSTTISMKEHQSPANADSSESITNQLDNFVVPLAVTEESNSEKVEDSVLEVIPETESVSEIKIIDKIKDTEEDSNSVNHQDNKVGTSEQISLPMVQNSLKPHPENASGAQNDDHIPGLNGIPYSEVHDDKTVETSILIDSIETSTIASAVSSNEASVLEGLQEDRPIKEIDGIFQEVKEDPLILTENSVETSTEKPIDVKMEGSIKTPLDENHTGTVIEHTTESSLQSSADENLPPMKLNEKTGLSEEPFSELNSISYSETNLSTDHRETSTQAPPVNSFESDLPEEVQEDQTSKSDNGILMEADKSRLSPNDESLPDSKLYEESIEASTEKPPTYKIDNPTTASLEKNHFGTTTDYSRHVDSLQTMRDESSSVVSEGAIPPASVGRSFNEIVAEGLGKPLPTRSVGDEPSSSSYSSEDKTTTVLVLCAATGGIFIAFSFAIYLISFQRQHGTLDIEMQEQRCGKDNLDDDDDSETRVSLLNQIPTVDSDEHSSD